MSDINDSDLAIIKENIANDKIIAAIKIYRDRTGCGLKEAKDYVDKLHAELRVSDPAKFKASKSGCAGVVLLLVFVGIFCSCVLLRFTAV